MVAPKYRKLKPTQPLQPSDPEPRLEPRERQILDLVGRGLSIPNIMEQLHLSRNSVYAYRGQLSIKFGLRGRDAQNMFARARTLNFDALNRIYKLSLDPDLHRCPATDCPLPYCACDRLAERFGKLYGAFVEKEPTSEP